MRISSAAWPDAGRAWAAELHYHHRVRPHERRRASATPAGGELILRDDDKPETVQKRLDVYHEQTQPLIDYYTNAGILQHRRRNRGSSDDVFRAITEILGGVGDHADH